MLCHNNKHIKLPSAVLRCHNNRSPLYVFISPPNTIGLLDNERVTLSPGVPVHLLVLGVVAEPLPAPRLARGHRRAAAERAQHLATLQE